MSTGAVEVYGPSRWPDQPRLIRRDLDQASLSMNKTGRATLLDTLVHVRGRAVLMDSRKRS